MRHIIIIVGLVAVLAFTTAQSGAGQATQVSKAEEAVRKLERAWLDAYEQHDAKAMDTIVADDFTITFPDGSMQTKMQVLNSIKSPRNPASPALKFYTEDVQSRVYDDMVVILTGRVVTEYQRDGKTMKEQNRYTDTYVRRQGRWQVVASHLSNVPRPRPQTTPTPSSTGTGNQ
jgi:uncharacterized protein (TIGR02246 family)